jgi:hypothetical protein
VIFSISARRSFSVASKVDFAAYWPVSCPPTLSPPIGSTGLYSAFPEGESAIAFE